MGKGGHNLIDLVGQRFGELVAISYNKGTKTIPSTWTCRCSCGNTINVPGFALRRGNYKSCGCKQAEKRNKGVKQHIKQDRIDGTRKTALTSKIHIANKSGVKGVRWDDKKNRWKAYIGFRGKQISLGSYLTKEEAIEARNKGEETYHKPILEED